MTQPSAPTEPTLSKAEREQKAIAAITQAGGTMSNQASGVVKWDEAIKPGQPILRLIFGNRNATDAILKQAKELKDLQELVLGGSPITDAGLREIAGLKSLKVLLAQRHEGHRRRVEGIARTQRP